MYYLLTLPMPISVNKAWDIGRGRAGRHLKRSDEYDEFTRRANTVWQSLCRQQGIPEHLDGRLRLDICFNIHNVLSDTSNRVKILEDWLQGKFFKNDNQIDDIRLTKRIWREIPEQAEVCISQIEDLRFQDPRQFFRN